MQRKFDWDPRKSARNWKKHQVAFQEAVTIFNDPFILSKFDNSHSDNEDRWISLGLSEVARVILVVHTQRYGDGEAEVIRLISARKADSAEEQEYMNRRPI